VPEEAHLYPHLTGSEYLQLAGRLRGMRRGDLDPRVNELLRLFGLWEDRHTRLASYSKGMRQKILLSSALLHDQEILILDEPFSGLDVNAAMVLRALLRGLAERRKLVLYSSHVLEVVEKVATSVLILQNGKVAAQGAIADLQSLLAKESLEGVFAQVTQSGEDAATTARRILETVSAA
jgi:ABC-2 type transport system ATP-binding protein